MNKYLTANNTFNYIDSLDKMIKKYNNTVHSSKDAVYNKNIIKLYNALCEIHTPIYQFYKFDIGNKVRIVKKRHLKKDILQAGLKNYSF